MSPSLPAESRLGPGQHRRPLGAWRHCLGWAVSCLTVPLPGPTCSPQGLAPTSLHPPVPASPTDFPPENWNLLSVFSLPDRLSNQALNALPLFPNYWQPWTHYTQRPQSWSRLAEPTPPSSLLGASSLLPNPLASLTLRIFRFSKEGRSQAFLSSSHPDSAEQTGPAAEVNHRRTLANIQATPSLVR